MMVIPSRSRRWSAFSYGLLLGLSGLAVALAGDFSPATAKKIDHIFADWDSTVSPGCALSVMRDGEILYKRGYGMADLDHDVPIRPDSVFHVASISKQFAAASIILLAQEGKLSFDDDVRKYIPELPNFGTPITIRHLIHHTSGLRDQWDLLNLAGWRYSLDLITDDDVLSLLSKQKGLNFQPGAEHLYCNSGYTLLAQIVKRVSGQSFREFTANRIFLPLKMTSTHFRDDHAEIVKHMAYGYKRDEHGAFELSVTNFDTVGATSLLTTVEDLARWDENFYHHQVGGAALIQQQLQQGKLNDGKEIDYAFGLQIGKYRGLPIVDHSGSDAGYRSDLVRFPQQHFSVACLCNLAQTNPGALTRKVADILLADTLNPAEPAHVAEVKTAATLSSRELNVYPGLYWEKSREQARTVTQREGKLYLSQGQPEDKGLEMEPIGAGRFRVPNSPAILEFQSTRPGGPYKMLWIVDPAADPQVFEPAASFSPAAEKLRDYVGAYRSEELDSTYRISAHKDGLVLTRLKFKPDPLKPAVTDYFRGQIGSIHFIRNRQGQVSDFLLNTGRVRNLKFSKTTEN